MNIAITCPGQVIGRKRLSGDNPVKDELHVLEDTYGMILEVFTCEKLWETINRAHYAANNGYRWFSFTQQKEYLVYENEIMLAEEVDNKKNKKKRKAKTK